MAEAHVNGVRLYYEERGYGDPILCIHGTSSSAMVWRPAAVELALRYPECVRALVLLEAAALTLDDEAMAWAEELRAAVEETAARDVSAVAETFLRRVVGDARWESFPDPLRQMFIDNSPA